MTVWYVITDYVFRVNSHFVGETLPKTSQRLSFHFSSYLVIELFHRRCLNDYFLLGFHFFCLRLGLRGAPLAGSSAAPPPVLTLGDPGNWANTVRTPLAEASLGNKEHRWGGVIDMATTRIHDVVFKFWKSTC